MPFSDRIFLNKAVDSIKWDATSTNHKSGIKVTCEDGSLYLADFVIVTSSLGFLKVNSDKLFIPALPVQKKRAIQVIIDSFSNWFNPLNVVLFT